MAKTLGKFKCNFFALKAGISNLSFNSAQEKSILS